MQELVEKNKELNKEVKNNGKKVEIILKELNVKIEELVSKKRELDKSREFLKVREIEVEIARSNNVNFKDSISNL